MYVIQVYRVSGYIPPNTFKIYSTNVFYYLFAGIYVFGLSICSALMKRISQ